MVPTPVTSQYWSHGSSHNHSDVNDGHMVANHVTSQCWSHGSNPCDITVLVTWLNENGPGPGINKKTDYFVIKMLFQVNEYFKLFRYYYNYSILVTNLDLAWNYE